jgi:hypothetical protein
MGLVAVDVTPDEIIRWFAVYPPSERARPLIGPCPHQCPHNLTATVGWGADLAHYELVRCDVRDGCNGNCRGWMAGTGATSYELHRRIEFKLLLGR